MNARVSFPGKHPLSVVCAFMVLSIGVLSSDSAFAANTVSHQPVTFDQMGKLVMPQDPSVAAALQEALAINSSNPDNTPQGVIDINKLRLWEFSNIAQDSDLTLHGVNDYWQTPKETLTLKAGDCEDFAILMVSMMRAYGVPKDQAYIAVGDDVNKNWHAFVIEKFFYGEWTEFDPENLDDAVLLGGNMPLPYDISYCFNDGGGFKRMPVYPAGYKVPPVNIVPVVPTPAIVTPGINLTYSLDGAKRDLGELWLPAYLPQECVLSDRFAYSISGKWQFVMMYRVGAVNQLYVSETDATEASQEGLVPTGTWEQVIINGKPAIIGSAEFSSGNGSSISVQSMLLLYFIQGSLEIHMGAVPADSMTKEDLIKIAESFAEYKG